ncbi:MAG TPA: hypothetical protein VGL33_11805 [Streptosporangiaceae bacterium]
MHQQLPAHHATRVAGVERPGDPSRTGRHRPAAHDGLSTALTQAIRKKPDCPGGTSEPAPQ